LLCDAKSKVRHTRGLNHADSFQADRLYVQMIEQPHSLRGIP
jgi:hypothetical protein